MLLNRAARTPFAVLLEGESGTGKEVVARAIHQASARADRPFVVIDCGSLVSTLVESELFGYSKGAFSGAIANKIGLVEAADGGTLFLDEIGDLPHDLQVKFLRLLQEREFRPVGALTPRTVDVRFIAATNRDLSAEVTAGRFRLDLYQRLNVFPIQLPPLSQRREDIGLLADHFVQEVQKLGLDAHPLDDEQRRVLEEYSWPGNVRELKHCIERMAALGIETATELRRILAPKAGPLLSPRIATRFAFPEQASTAGESMSLADGESRLIAAALASTSGNRAKAAEILRISRTTLYRRLRHGHQELLSTGPVRTTAGVRHRAEGALSVA